MEQQVQFCTTADGVRIAYSVAGSGPALVWVLGWFTHLEYSLQYAPWRNIIERLSARHRLVRYDGRGIGLSDRRVEDFSVDAKVRDLMAVIDALKLRRVALLGSSEGGPTAITYAVRHPERVSHLVLHGTYARLSRSPAAAAQMDALATLMRNGWGSDSPAFRQLFAAMQAPGASAEQTRSITEMQRASASAETAERFLRSLPGIDVTELAPLVRAPTLAVHARGDGMVPYEWGRRLAGLIPGARFISLETANHTPLPDDPETDRLLETIEAFIGGGRPKPKRASAARAAATEPSAGALPSAPNATSPSAGVVTILFTDLAGSTELLDRLGDETYELLRRTHFRLLREVVAEHGGEEVKNLGDGLMVVFPSPVRALACAVSMQRAVEGHNQHHPGTPLRVRVGLHAGEPIREEGDYFGTPVVVARRLCERAEAGQVLASDLVRQLAGSRAGVQFRPLGPLPLKGFATSVPASEVSS